QDPFELMAEIASKLALDTVPMGWPAGMGGLLRGIFDPENDRFVPYSKPDVRGIEEPESIDSARMSEFMNADELATFRDEWELARGGSPEFDVAQYLAGHMTPVYFGSALRKLGVRELLEAVVRFAPSPRPQPAATRPGRKSVVWGLDVGC